MEDTNHSSPNNNNSHSNSNRDSTPLSSLLQTLNSHFLASLEILLQHHATNITNNNNNNNIPTIPSNTPLGVSLEATVTHFLETAKQLETEFAQLQQRFNINSETHLSKVQTNNNNNGSNYYYHTLSILTLFSFRSHLGGGRIRGM